MDRNGIIGFVLLVGIFIVWQYSMAPSQAEIEAEQRRLDSLAQIETVTAINTLNDSLANTAPVNPVASYDSSRLVQEFGPFAGATSGNGEIINLSNNLIQVDINTKGGRINRAALAEYYKISEDENKEEIKSTLELLEDNKDVFEYVIPMGGVASGVIRTSDLVFTPVKSGNTLTLRADAGQGRYIEQAYTLKPDSYELDYTLKLVGLQNVISGENPIQLNWTTYLDKLEKNVRFERNYSTSYFYETEDEETDYCNCMRSSDKDREGQKIKWVSHSNQFFASTLIADESFTGGMFESEMYEEDAPNLKKLSTQLTLPYERESEKTYAMTWVVGPKDFDMLQTYGHQLTDIIPFGRSFFGSINRWIIRPLFNFLDGIIGSKGLSILALILLVKLALFPLTYKMLYSQSKMSALKPEIEKLNDKYKDKPQEKQMASMKLYQEYGVSPLGGCMPMVLQMPIWFALYRFFPAAIEFRQAPFLWATDLSSYDVIARLPFEIPAFGSHLSLFTLLWAVTTLIYTYYNTRHMDMSAQPAMKYVQYLMPIFFLGFFNSYAAGLTCYLLFSNLFNIASTIITKEYVIDKEKIKMELNKNKAKPKKQSGFRARLEEAMKEQQRIQQEQEAKKKNRSKKK